MSGSTSLVSLLPVTDQASEDVSTKLISYFHQFSATGEKEMDPVLMDHCYSRPWNWRPETSFIRPTKTLFIPKSSGSQIKQHQTKLLAQQQISTLNSNVVDVIGVAPQPALMYDVEKARNLMEECVRHAVCARIDEGNDDWEDSISRVNWSAAQNRLFSSMVKILNSDRMARLAYAGSWNEPVLRRAVIDKSVQRMRSLMAGISWDVRLTQWLHALLIDNLSTAYLAAYLDILQTLKSKLPTFVEKMMFGPNSSSRVGVTSNESLFPLLKRPWDPVASSLLQDKPKKLPGNPVFIVAPSGPSAGVGGGFSKRLHRWTNLLTSLAHVITVGAHVGAAGRATSMTTCADQLLASVRAKVQEVRADCPSRPIVLVGFNAGAALVCQATEVERVAAVVCMGFPLLTAEGRRGEPDDILLEMQCPVLFVIGQNAHRTSREEMEDLRERMRVETGLVVVGSADDYLRMRKSKKRSEGITQSIVDRCILDEIGEFVGSILVAPYTPTVSRQVSTSVSNLYVTAAPSAGQYLTAEHQNSVKRMKMERVRNNSNGSSVESEPPSPQPAKLTRPGRPPGSGKKKNLLHHFQGTVPSNKSPINTPTDTGIIPTNSDTSHASPNSSVSPISNSAETPPSLTTFPVHCAGPLSFGGVVQQQGTTPTSGTQQQLHAMGVISSRSVLTSGGVGTGTASTLTSLLQQRDSNTSTATHRTVTTIAPTTNPTTIRVMENIPITSGTKMLSAGGRTVDLSKVTLVNTAGLGTGTGGSSIGKSTSLGNVVLLSDGTRCIRSSGMTNMLQSVKTIGGSAVVLPMQCSLPTRTGIVQSQNQQRSPGVAKLVPTRRQVITKQRTQPVTPPSLSTADIMDLPIIFADSDDGLLTGCTNLEQATTGQESLHVSQQQHILGSAQKRQPAANKFVVINKQTMVPSSTGSYQQQSTLKRGTAGATVRGGTSTKYARIIINQNQLQDTDMMDSKPHILITGQKIKTSESTGEIVTVSPKKIDTCPSLELIDLESELKVNTVPKPIAANQHLLTGQPNQTNRQIRPELKHFTTASRNVTVRMPVSASVKNATTIHSTSVGADSIQFVLNRSGGINRTTGIRRAPIKSTSEQIIKHKNVSYRIENIYTEEEHCDDQSELDV